MLFRLFLLVAPLILTSSAAASPAVQLAEAERMLLDKPPLALSMCRAAIASMPAGSDVVWQGENMKSDDLQERVEVLAAAYAATDERASLAAYCLDQLLGPDRIALAVELARRHVRDGEAEAALALAEEEKLSGEARMRVLMALTNHFQTTGESSRLKETVDEMIQIYPNLHPWVQGLVQDGLADTLVATERFVEVVALAHELGGWRQPYYFSRAAKMFPDWQPSLLRNQALGLAQDQEPSQKSIALIRLAHEFDEHEEDARADELLESSHSIATTLMGRDKAMTFALLAEVAARRERQEEASSHLAAALETIIVEMDGWEQTDALNELARTLAGTAAAPLAGPRIEEAAAQLSMISEDFVMRNKYRVYELLGMSAAVSPATEYTLDDRRLLFTELIRLQKMPDAESESAGE